MSDIKTIDGPNLKLLNVIANNIKAPNMEEQDNNAKIYNESIKHRAMIIFGILFILGISISSFMMIYYHLDYKKIILRGLLSLSAVMIVYFLYTTYVLGTYHSADPNVVKKAIIDSLIYFEKK
jgi:polyferredoxin